MSWQVRFRPTRSWTLLATDTLPPLLLAALLSAVPCFEIFVEALHSYGVSRRRGIALMGLIEVVLGIPSILRLDILLYNDLLWGTTMLPIASPFSIVAFGWFVDKSALLKELGLERERVTWKALYHWVRLSMPLMIVMVLVYGWISFLAG